MIRAETIDEIIPLAALCRAGKLFEVQDWIREGKPVALPEGTGYRFVQRVPLYVAIERGFHSLVQVLLDAGAPVHESNHNALKHAVAARRPDIAELLMQHGATVDDVDMSEVLETWDSDMVELFVSKGGDLERDNPIASALINKIRPVLGLLKRHAATNPRLTRQADVALRFHAYEGNVKWVSLLLWVGANPCTVGPYRWEDLGKEAAQPDYVGRQARDDSDESDEADDDVDDDAGDDVWRASAVELAIIAGKPDVLKVKKFIPAPDPTRPETMAIIKHVGRLGADFETLSLLLARGHRPTTLPDKGTATINGIVWSMEWDPALPRFGERRRRTGLDSWDAQKKLKMLHALVAHGARWLPKDKNQICNVRQILLKMKPDYILEFAWIMRKFGAARRRDVEELMRTPSVARLLGKERAKANEIVGGIPEEPSATE